VLTQIQYDAKSVSIPKSSGRVGTPFSLKIVVRPNGAVQWRTLAFKNVSSAFSFSPGIRIADTHYVNSTDLDKLTITVSKSAPPGSMVTALLLNDDRIQESHDLKIVVADAEVTILETIGWGAEPSSAVAIPSPKTNAASSAEPAAGSASLDQALEASYLQRAKKLLDLRQIAPARLLLEHLANKGSAKGAMQLAETYDENYLRSLNVVGGVSADRTKAIYWYRKAEELGAGDASAHIQRLN
jgi:hypothetical protein